MVLSISAAVVVSILAAVAGLQTASAIWLYSAYGPAPRTLDRVVSAAVTLLMVVVLAAVNLATGGLGGLDNQVVQAIANVAGLLATVGALAFDVVALRMVNASADNRLARALDPDAVSVEPARWLRVTLYVSAAVVFGCTSLAVLL